MKLKMNAPLDPGFMPMAVVYREFEEAVAKEGGQKLTIGLERNDGLTSTYTVEVFKDGTGHDEENHEFVERLVKTLLWTRGGYKIIIAGSKVIADKIKAAPDGSTVELDAGVWRCYTDKIMQEMKKHNVNLKTTYMENGVTHSFTIPAKEIPSGEQFYGFTYLFNKYGK